MTNPIYRADAAIASVLQGTTLQQNELLHAVARAFNWWGGPGVIYFAAVLWLGGRALRRARISVVGLRGAEAIAVASAISGIVKGFAGRARPFVAPGEPWHWNFLHGWTDARYFSMPSGHTTASIAFAAAVCVTSARWPRPARITLTLGAFTAAFLVAFARTYTNQHWFSDVIAGAILGATTGMLIARWHERHPSTGFDRVLAGVAAVPEGA
jgi:membrane-associated phospholipid phosphatase